MALVAIASTMIIGLTVGLLGGGGSILMVPLLVHGIGFEPKQAIASSLLVIGVTSLVGTALHARAGRVDGRIGGVFALGGMAGSYTGGRLAAFVPGDVLLVLFAVMMLLTAVAMLRRRKESLTPRSSTPRLGRSLALGASVGIVAGLVGAGGGFLIVPILTLVGGLSMPRAVGTSLFVIALQSLAGFAGHVAHERLDYFLLGRLTLACVLGVLLGNSLMSRIPASSLRRAFGGLVFTVGTFVFGAQLVSFL